MKNTMNNSERMELLCSLVEVFEDWLDDKGIVVENEEKQEDSSNIYGEDYFILESRLGHVLEDWNLIPTEKELFYEV